MISSRVHTHVYFVAGSRPDALRGLPGLLQEEAVRLGGEGPVLRAVREAHRELQNRGQLRLLGLALVLPEVHRPL